MAGLTLGRTVLRSDNLEIKVWMGVLLTLQVAIWFLWYDTGISTIFHITKSILAIGIVLLSLNLVEIRIPKKFSDTDRKFLRNPNLNEISFHFQFGRHKC